MRSFLRGFAWAFNGIRVTAREERNFRFHLCAAVYVYLFSIFYPFGAVEYAILTVLVGGVLALEVLNSAIERVMDRLAPEPNRLAGLAKDMAAGAVLVFSIAAAVCGVLLFWNTAIFYEIFTAFTTHIWMPALLLLSLAGSWWFVFRYNRKDNRY